MVNCKSANLSTKLNNASSKTHTKPSLYNKAKFIHDKFVSSFEPSLSRIIKMDNSFLKVSDVKEYIMTINMDGIFEVINDYLKEDALFKRLKNIIHADIVNTVALIMGKSPITRDKMYFASSDLYVVNIDLDGLYDFQDINQNAKLEFKLPFFSGIFYSPKLPFFLADTSGMGSRIPFLVPSFIYDDRMSNDIDKFDLFVHETTHIDFFISNLEFVKYINSFLLAHAFNLNFFFSNKNYYDTTSQVRIFHGDLSFNMYHYDLDELYAITSALYAVNKYYDIDPKEHISGLCKEYYDKSLRLLFKLLSDDNDVNNKLSNVIDNIISYYTRNTIDKLYETLNGLISYDPSIVYEYERFKIWRTFFSIYNELNNNGMFNDVLIESMFNTLVLKAYLTDLAIIEVFDLLSIPQ